MMKSKSKSKSKSSRTKSKSSHKPKVAPKVNATKVEGAIGKLLSGDAITPEMITNASTPRRVATLLLAQGKLNDDAIYAVLLRRFGKGKGASRTVISPAHWRNPKGRVIEVKHVQHWRNRMAQGRVQTLGRAPARLQQKWVQLNPHVANDSHIGVVKTARKVRAIAKQGKAKRRAA